MIKKCNILVQGNVCCNPQENCLSQLRLNFLTNMIKNYVKCLVQITVYFNLQENKWCVTLPDII
jgi:hypothetical protein